MMANQKNLAADLDDFIFGNQEQIAVRLAVMKHAGKSIMLFDSTKKNVVYAFTVCHEEELYKMITCNNC